MAERLISPLKNLRLQVKNLSSHSCSNFHALIFLNLVLRQFRWSQWPRGLRRRSAAARLPRSWIRIPPGAWMFVCCECCVLSVRGLCDELITRPEKSYRLRCVVVCDLETSWIRRPWPALGRSATGKNKLRQFHPTHNRLSEPFSTLGLKLKLLGKRTERVFHILHLIHTVLKYKLIPGL